MREAVLAISDLIPNLLRPVPEADPEAEAAFSVFAAQLTRQLGILGAAVLALATLAWWPLDALVHQDAVVRAAFARLRWHALLAEVFSLGVLALVARHPRWVFPAAVVLHGMVLGAMGEALGWLGRDGVDRGQLVWLADAWIGVVPFAVVPMRAGARVVGTALVAVGLGGSFFLLHPANLALPGAAAQISFGVFAFVFTAAVGEASLRVTRRAFLESRALDAANAELAALSSSLSDQVAERTEALRALAQHLEQSQETERRRLAHDLHDDLGQQLTAMRYGVARLKGRLDAGGDGRPLVEDLEASLDGTARATRAVITRLRPRILDDLGLLPALEWLGEDVAERAGLPCRVDLDEADPAALATLDAATQLVLYRAAQEGTTNALKHAAAGQIQVSVRCAEGRVEVGVIDDGSGFDPALPNGGFGLLGLRERLVALDGGLRIDSAPGAGTRLCAWVPRSSEEAR